MRMTRPALAAIGVAGIIALAGCTSSGSSGDMSPSDECGANAVQSQIGGQVTGSSASDARIDGQPVASNGTVRVIGPDTMVTQDFRPDRLNLEVDAAGRLVAARCG